jgi:hypothetical protein
MKKLLLSTAIVLGLTGATFAVPGTADASGFAISFNADNVAFGYQDGYWDRDHRWHHWRNQREARRYRDTHGSRYNHWRHDRDADQGWRDDGPDGPGPGPGPGGPGPGPGGPGPGPGGQN